MMEAQAKDLKAIEDYIYSSMNHTEEWREAEQAYQNILNSRSAKSDAVLEPDEVLDKLCWADVVMLVMGYKEKEDISFCKGESCNYCGKFGELRQKER